MMNYEHTEEFTSPDINDATMINDEIHVKANEGGTHLAIDFDKVKNIVDFCAHSSCETASNSTGSRILKQRRPELHRMIIQEPVKLVELKPITDDHATIKKQKFQEAEEVNYKAVHMRKFCCYICGKRFIRFSHLKCHLHIHTRKICRQQFSKSSHMSTYIRRHLNNRVHQCRVCHRMHLDIARFADHSSWYNDRHYRADRGIAMGDSAGVREANFERQMQITEDGIPLSNFYEHLELVSCAAIEKLDNSIDDEEYIHCQRSP